MQCGEYSEPAVFFVLIVLLIIQAVILLWVQFKKSKVSTSERAGLFGDKEFGDKFKGSDEEKMQKFGDVTEQYHFYKTDKSYE